MHVQVPAVVRGQLDDQIKSVVREVLREMERAAADGDAAPADPTTANHVVTAAVATGDDSGPGAEAKGAVAQLGAIAACDAGVALLREGPAAGATRAVEGDAGAAADGCAVVGDEGAGAGAGAADGVAGVDAAGGGDQQPCKGAGREGQQQRQQQGQGSGEQQQERVEEKGKGQEGKEKADSPAAVANRLARALLSLSRSAAGEQQGQGQAQGQGQEREREKEGSSPVEKQLVPAALQAAGSLLATAPAWTPGEEPPPAVAAAVTLVARTLYGTVRRSVRRTAELDRLLIAVLRATSAAVAERAGGVGSGMGVGGPDRAGARAVTVGGAGGGAVDGCTALVLLAEVALGVIQQHASDAPNWVHAVWAGSQGWDDEDEDEQEDGEERGERGPERGANAQDGAQEGRGAVAAAAAAGEEGGGGREVWGRLRRPPMVVNLYSQVAVYGRDLEVYRPLHVLRTALQRVTLGPVVGGAVQGLGSGEDGRSAV